MTAARHDADAYAGHRERMAARSRERVAAGSDIAAGYPGHGDPERRRRCERDLRLHLETYHPQTFRLAWSGDQIDFIAVLREIILAGGLRAEAMPRASGKTAISIRAALWAALHRHRRFVCLIGATETKAERELMAGVKAELLWNDLLAEDFPEVCYPFRCLGGNARRAIGQTFGGQRTAIDWGARRVVFPTMPDSACGGANVSGAVVTAVGLTGAIRGQQHTLTTGEITRPDLVLLDDPQTRESAKSEDQSNDRAAIVCGDVLGMAGPDSQITAVMTCTVIRAGDLSDRMLDRKINPQWRGRRSKALRAWPADMQLWDRYRELRAEAMRRDLPPGEAAAHLRDHWEAMHAGAEVAWEARKAPGDLSALQTLMHLYFDMGEEAFLAEMQNEPRVADAGPSMVLPAAEIMQRLNHLPRGAVPGRATVLTAMIDVHDELLYWAVCAFAPDFTGSVLDYGAFPDQGRRAFTLRRASPTLSTLTPRAGREGVIRAGLEALCDRLIPREWKREDGAGMRVERCHVDAGWAPDVVYEFCRRSHHRGVLCPSRGIGVSAGKKPIDEYLAKPGDRAGHGWILGRGARRADRYVRFDANLWKTFLHARLGMAVGDKGGLTLYGASPEHHQSLAQHLTAERPAEDSRDGRTVLVWELPPERPDNHWLDVLVGCCVAASVEGCALPGVEAKPQRRRRKVTWADLQKAQGART